MQFVHGVLLTMSEDVSDDIKLVMKLERRLAELCQHSNRVRLSLL